MGYTIDNAMEEMHKKDDQDKVKYCEQHYRNCNDCRIVCHLNANMFKKIEYCGSLGLNCITCKNMECEYLGY